MLSVDGYEREETGHRTAVVLQHKKKTAGGRSINGRAPYGWQWVGEKRYKRLVEQPKETRVVHRLLLFAKVYGKVVTMKISYDWSKGPLHSNSINCQPNYGKRCSVMPFSPVAT